jgi:zinc transport system permease protein
VVSEFVGALLSQDIPFLRYALIAGVLSSMAFGVVGTYVVVQRISYMAGAISHAVLGGIGLALYLNRAQGLTFIQPIHGALVFALLAAVLVSAVSQRARQREDTILGALWSVGMAVGVLFLAKTPGYVDPMSYLFGNILIMSRQDLWLIVGLDLVILLVAVVFYHQFAAVIFDREFAIARGLRVGMYSTLMLCLAALTVVLMVGVVGIVMVVALLTLPAAIAGLFCRSLKAMMVTAALLCMIFTSTGLGVSYAYDLPTGPTVILIAGIAYALALAVRRFRNRGGAVQIKQGEVEQSAGCWRGVQDGEAVETGSHNV